MTFASRDASPGYLPGNPAQSEGIQIMGTHLSKYPSQDDVRALVTDDELATALDALHDHDRTQRVVTFDEPTQSIRVAVAWLQLVQAIREESDGDIQFTHSQITRDRTPDELITTALDKIRTDRYYQPAKYGYLASDTDGGEMCGESGVITNDSNDDEQHAVCARLYPHTGFRHMTSDRVEFGQQA